MSMRAIPERACLCPLPPTTIYDIWMNEIKSETSVAWRERGQGTPQYLATGRGPSRGQGCNWLVQTETRPFRCGDSRLHKTQHDSTVPVIDVRIAFVILPC